MKKNLPCQSTKKLTLTNSRVIRKLTLLSGEKYYSKMLKKQSFSEFFLLQLTANTYGQNNEYITKPQHSHFRILRIN